MLAGDFNAWHQRSGMRRHGCEIGSRALRAVRTDVHEFKPAIYSNQPPEHVCYGEGLS